MPISEELFWIIFAIPSIIIASTVHEYAHALAAFKLGDPTAKAEGRMTLNPIPHIDPLGAICMVLFRFGWSKPVPINEYNFDNRVLGTAITAIAGPISNLLVVAVMAIINTVFQPDLSSVLGSFLLTFTIINLALAFFNLIPIPPLDGHKIVRAILPKGLRYHWENLEKIYIVLLAILILPVTSSGSIASLYMTFVISRSLDILGFL